MRSVARQKRDGTLAC